MKRYPAFWQGARCWPHQLRNGSLAIGLIGLQAFTPQLGFALEPMPPSSGAAKVSRQGTASTALAPTAPPASGALMPFKHDANRPADDGGPPLGMLAVLLMLGLLVYATFAWRHRSAPGKPRAKAGTFLTRWAGARRRMALELQVKSSTRLTPQHSLHEVHWHGQRLLVGCAPDAMCLLMQQTLPPQDAQDLPPTPGLLGMLATRDDHTVLAKEKQ